MYRLSNTSFCAIDRQGKDRTGEFICMDSGWFHVGDISKLPLQAFLTSEPKLIFEEHAKICSVKSEKKKKNKCGGVGPKN